MLAASGPLRCELATTCADDFPSGAVDGGHAPVVVGTDPNGCRLDRLRDVGPPYAALPPAVAAAIATIEAVPDHKAALAIGPSAWEIGDWDDAATNQRAYCPLPIRVFVRAPDGVVELDVPDHVDGILADAEAPRVLITGAYGLDPRAFDFTNLPRHRPGVRSTSTKNCIR